MPAPKSDHYRSNEPSEPQLHLRQCFKPKKRHRWGLRKRSSSSLSDIAYDDLNRLISLNSAARGVKTFAYNALGNILTNQENGNGLYQYGLKPHAVTNANNISYNYDACGNMITRGTQTLVYDEQNQLSRVITTNSTVDFGYDEGGERLWRSGTNGYTIWIGGLYEINNGKVLCHVYASSRLIATFEPQCNVGMSRIIGEERWFTASTWIDATLSWPFQHGRTQWTIFICSWLGILTLCGAGIHAYRSTAHLSRKPLHKISVWHRLLTASCISAFLWSSVGNADASTYNPVFYYYHADTLGSSNILTDRSGSLVQHFEYSAFGQTSYSVNNFAFPVSNRYTGQIADDETGLYYYGGRCYDPQLGRFIQPDPNIPDPADSQSLNRYSYVRNNPLNATDPTGFDDEGSADEATDSSWEASYTFPTVVTTQGNWSISSTTTLGSDFSSTTVQMTYLQSDPAFIPGTDALAAPTLISYPPVTTTSYLQPYPADSPSAPDPVVQPAAAPFVPNIFDAAPAAGFTKMLAEPGEAEAEAMRSMSLAAGGIDYQPGIYQPTEPSGNSFLLLAVVMAAPELLAGRSVGVAAESGASSALQGARLSEHLTQLEKYGFQGFRNLENGSIRYYGELKAASTPGEMSGARLVREWNPETGARRTWYETLDHSGTVRSVRPQTGGPKVHYIFDANGNYTGTR